MYNVRVKYNKDDSLCEKEMRALCLAAFLAP